MPLSAFQTGLRPKSPGRNCSGTQKKKGGGVERCRYGGDARTDGCMWIILLLRRSTRAEPRTPERLCLMNRPHCVPEQERGAGAGLRSAAAFSITTGWKIAELVLMVTALKLRGRADGGGLYRIARITTFKQPSSRLGEDIHIFIVFFF